MRCTSFPSGLRKSFTPAWGAKEGRGEDSLTPGEALGGREGRGEDRGSLRGDLTGPETTWGSITVLLTRGRVWGRGREGEEDEEGRGTVCRRGREEEEEGGRGGRGTSAGPELGLGTWIIRT